MATQEKTWNVANRLHSLKDSDNPEVNHIIAGADEIYDDAKELKQSEHNAQTDDRLNEVETDLNAPTGGIKDRVHTLEEQVAFEGDVEVENTPQNIISGSGKVTSANAVRGAIDVRTGYFFCESGASTAEKTITAPGFVLTPGGGIKIKMTNDNTADNATLNIQSTGAKPLYYNGERASASNSWEAGETIEVYYDGTNFMANNVAGGGGSGDCAFDVSAKYPTSGVEGGNTYTLAGALAVLNANLSARNKKGGMSIKFIQSSDNKYVQYRLMSTDWSIDVSNWQGVDDEPTAGSDNLVKSGGVKKAISGKILNRVDEADWDTGKIIKADGSIVTESYSTNYAISTFNVSEYDIFYGDFYCDGSGNDLAVAFYDSSDTFISRGRIFGNAYSVGWHHGSSTAPENATKIKIVGNNLNHVVLYKISFVDTELDANSNLPVANKVITAALAKLDGYAYQGIATASTNPGTPAEKVFYLAQAAGTYTNFNSLVVKRGLAILKYNNSWTLDQLFVTNDYITDSTDLLLSSAVKNSSVVVECKSTDMVSSKYLQRDGTLVSGASAARRNYYFDIVAGNTYLVYGFTESNSSYVVFVCYDSNGTRVPIVPESTYDRGTSLQEVYLTFTAPTGATKCIVHSNNFVARLWEINNVFFDNVPSFLSKKLLLSGSVWGLYNGATKELEYTMGQGNKLLNSQGELVNGSGYVRTSIVSPNKRLLIYCIAVSDTNYLNYAFYNGDTFISGGISPFFRSGVSGGQYFSVISPANADTLKVWSSANYRPTCYETVLVTDTVLANDGRMISSNGIAQAINPLTARVTTIENTVSVPNTISLKKDGTGDYTTLRAAIEYAKEHTPITIQIYPGTYNISDEYTTEEIDAASLDGFCGWDLWNNINLKGMSNNRADVVLHAEASLDDTPSLARTAISTLNLRGNNRIENLTITSRNVRYPIHDDFDTNISKVHEIVNCYIESYFPYYYAGPWNGIGYGAQKFKKLYIEGCEVYPQLMCHNGNQAGGSDIFIKDTKTNILSLQAYADMDMDRYQLYNVSYNRLQLVGANANSFNVVSTHNSKGVIICRSQDNYVTEEVQKFSRVSVTASIGQAAYIDGNFALASSGTFYGIYITDVSNGNALVQTCGIISENKLGGVDTTAWAVGDELSVGSNGKLEKSSTAPVAKVKYIIDSTKYIELT